MESTMISKSLQAYADALNTEGFGAWYEDASEGSSISSLFAVLHVDDSGQKYLLQAFDARELATAAFPESDAFPIALLQLVMQYPVPVVPLCFADTTRLLDQLSNLLPVGVFLLSEDEKAVFFRASIPVDDTGLSTECFVGTMDVIRHFCVECSGLIEAVASGQLSYQEAMSLLRDTGTATPVTG
jgi:hypothetical protein